MEKIVNKICEETKESENSEWYQCLRDALLIATKESNFEEIFKTHAEELMSQYALTNGNETFLFKEIEYYFYDEIRHPDPYVHGSCKQEEAGKYYYHYSGLDITFGDKDYSYSGGILISGICEMTASQEEACISGSRKSIYKMLKCDKSSYKWSQIDMDADKKPAITVCKLKSKRDIELVASFRVGLKAKSSDYDYFTKQTTKTIPFIFRKYKFCAKLDVSRKFT